MAFNNLRKLTVFALSAAMIVSLGACGTSEKSDSTASGDSKSSSNVTGYDVSGVTKDADITAMLPESVTKDKLTIGMDTSYAPAEFLAEDGKTPVGFDVDIAKALANMFGLEAVPQTEGTLEALGEDVGVTKEAVAIKKGDSDTAKAVQAALQKLMDDGTYMKILKHWGVETGAIDKAEINPTDLG
ncbi:transporter substrate-binding domain-containing protein [uncultured Bifidobacterium sp.]|uniref:transporter substrate-binding domain-containing protein n=1 Tax=uncultured Bifidobacterium sp. TaxID=165187 RepID=UPI002604047F|nr:transporter substrate-binding domain-containing protein [uncultured Bifidobacterium sp.]